MSFLAYWLRYSTLTIRSLHKRIAHHTSTVTHSSDSISVLCGHLMQHSSRNTALGCSAIASNLGLYTSAHVLRAM